jgi:hypothetical protein
MPRKLRVNKAKEQMSDLQWDFLCGRPLPELSFESFVVETDFNKNNQELWQLHREVILIEHIKTAPGTRPSLFWTYDAPRLPIGTFPGCFYDGLLPEPRKRVGGTGKPAYEVKCVKPSFQFGLPDHWCNIDERDPPKFESQAEYLKRNGFLFPGEEKRSDFSPETIPAECDWDIRYRRDLKDGTGIWASASCRPHWLAYQLAGHSAA